MLFIPILGDGIFCGLVVDYFKGIKSFNNKKNLSAYIFGLGSKTYLQGDGTATADANWSIEDV